MRTSAKPKVFISYVWLDKKDKNGNPVVLKNGKVARIPDERAFNLAERLREFGFDSRLDVYFKDAHDKYGFLPPVRRPGDSRDPWIIWAEQQIRDADCVLLLCTPEYVASDPNLGGCPGAWFNWHLLDDKLKVKTQVPFLWWDWHYIAKDIEAKPEKFIPIGFGPYDSEQIPIFVQGATYCNLESTKDFEGLIRRIKSEYRKLHPREGIFVSYSHKDKKLFNEFNTMMAPAIQKGIVDIWDDTKIKAGAKWREEIQDALSSPKVAVLLVSQNFLESKFIAQHELPLLLRAAEQEGVTVFWIYLSSCLYEQTEIAEYQASHDVARPLDRRTKSERQAILSEVCAQLIRLAVRRAPI